MHRTLVALALALTLGGCDDDNESTDGNGVTSATEASIAEVTVSATPILVPATPTGDADFPWVITWVTTVRETAGVAARVDRVSVVLVDTKVIYEGVDLAAIGTTQVAANGSVSYDLALVYALADGGRLAVVSIIVDLTDSRGNTVQASGQLRIV